MISPRLAFAGTLIRARAMSVLHARGQRDDQFRRAGPERAVRELRHRDDVLRVAKPDAGGNARTAGPRIEVERANVGLRIPLVENGYRLDEIRFRHWAVDGDRQRHGVAVLDQGWNVHRHPAGLDWRTA